MSHYSFSVTSEPIRAGISYAPTQTINTGVVDAQTGLLEFENRAMTAIIPTTQEIISEINYTQLAQEHAELIQQGKTSVEIAQWIGDKLNIPSWKSGEFYGERKVLSSPKTTEETQRLQKFVEALGVSWTKANQPSKNHSQYLLLDGYVQNALFGKNNMKQVDGRLDTFVSDWEKMGDDLTKKAQYLFEKIGLDIKGDWLNLTGICHAPGNHRDLHVLYVSGSLDDGSFVRYVLQFWLHSDNADTNMMNASSARLCFLA